MRKILSGISKRRWRDEAAGRRLPVDGQDDDRAFKRIDGSDQQSDKFGDDMNAPPECGFRE